MADDRKELIRKTVLAHRILTMTGSMGDITGHVFTRTGPNEFIARGRNGDDVSPAFVEPVCMKGVDLDGNPTEDHGGYWVPPERFIATSVFKARPDINCVIHAHPPAQVLCSVTDTEIRPIVGSQNWTGSMTAQGGIPVYPRSLLIHSPQIGRAMMLVMGNKDVVILKAHGNVVAGASVEQATLTAIALERLARLSWQIRISGRHSDDIPWEDFEDMTASVRAPRPAGEYWAWEYYVRMLSEGAIVPPESTVSIAQDPLAFGG